ncbi:type VI secretion system tube protein Hcp [Enterobacter asburiae]|nr:type VI secretion system tube protein Hcp [Enterobacter asburiae]
MTVKEIILLSACLSGNRRAERARAGSRKRWARLYSTMLVIKEFDCSSPYLYKDVATGQNLSSAEIKWYRINYSGLEEEYFNMLPEDVRIVLISPAMTTGDNPNENPMETVELRYEKSPGRSILSLPEIYGHCYSQ